MTDNRTTELQSLSKLKRAGRLRFWRGTIEIPETELHAICDEIQAEYDNAVHALNKSAGNWAKADAELRAEFNGIPMTEENMAAHGWVRERTCRVIGVDKGYTIVPTCDECGHEWVQFHYCPNCGAKVVDDD